MRTFYVDNHPIYDNIKYKAHIYSLFGKKV